ncbi:4-hydroxy-3-polyprenylbenzoate decarboxylase [Malonomonas rubra DSM 5091]|uniref:4-hydroxy-3-polyprenylbenzoate decarboxylase n=1 Tax=Malonomonas rubra DSM 5091 TaxID=1122189 RepID=A0A1M6HGF1_MALRU|nr:UbiD family decarboxylase [Malonomonas rubra]SHJ21296.1 4-hydroxy-3-polyprenylbenzoate decarboxylase [Malonomonas rubra DSM 5091]
MGYRNLREAVNDLESSGQLVKIDQQIDPEIEAGVIQRRVYQAGGPALLFTNLKGCDFPAVANLFGTLERTRYLFRDTLKQVETLVKLKLDPKHLLRHPSAFLSAPPAAFHLLPKKVKTGPILGGQTTLSKLPQIKSWPDDGGAFITLPQVYSESSLKPGLRSSNLGMYRVQISGNDYLPDQEAGLHYQIHRGIGVHHREALDLGRPFRVNVFIGGPPSMTVAAVMPLPEGMPELAFAGLLGGHRIPLVQPDGLLPMPAEADFVISGTIDPNQLKPEGPFGDHIGYYSLAHDFPLIKVDRVYHRPDAIWPFTTVGRPPQEDTSFGAFIHELTGELIPDVLPGIKGVHAVDAAGVHPLLLATGSERYTPYNDLKEPQEILTQANAVLGQGQLSLAKYLLIAAENDDPQLDVHDIPAFFRHILERIDWRRDLHFQTRTTIDTLDYSGHGLNQGSKVIMAAAGRKKRELPAEIPAELKLPRGYKGPRVAMPGVLLLSGPPCDSYQPGEDKNLLRLAKKYSATAPINEFPLIIVVDDSEFCAATLNNWLWTCFTRSNPAADLYGIDSSISAKHWGCNGSLIIDARQKPHHAPPLIEVPEVEKRVDQLAAKGGPLYGII